MTTINPLAELRRKGFDADLHQDRVRVWPRHQVTKALARFVTFHLAEIAQALRVESNEKLINNVFLWDLPAPQRTAIGNPDDTAAGEIPDYMNGERFAGFKAVSV